MLDDIVYDATARVLFETDEFSRLPNSQIWGNAAIFDFQQTLGLRQDHQPLATTTSSSTLIDVTLALGATEIKVNVKNVPNNDAFAVPRDDVTSGTTPSTSRSSTRTSRRLIEIHNLQVANAPPGESDWDVILNGLIENPIGTTRIRADRGDIENGGGSNQLIRTNVLDLDAPNGSIGSHVDPHTSRVPVNIELIESDYTETGVPPASDPKRRMPIGTYTAEQGRCGARLQRALHPRDRDHGRRRRRRRAQRRSRSVTPTRTARGAAPVRHHLRSDRRRRRHRHLRPRQLRPYEPWRAPAGSTSTATRSARSPTSARPAGERFFRPDCTPSARRFRVAVHALGVYATGRGARSPATTCSPRRRELHRARRRDRQRRSPDRRHALPQGRRLRLGPPPHGRPDHLSPASSTPTPTATPPARSSCSRTASSTSRSGSATSGSTTSRRARAT